MDLTGKHLTAYALLLTIKYYISVKKTWTWHTVSNNLIQIFFRISMEYHPVPEIIGEVESLLQEPADQPDHVTVSGCGEPTLYSRLGDLISAIKDLTQKKEPGLKPAGKRQMESLAAMLGPRCEII
ncbi:MAG: hypothetical protein PHW43_03930 [Syntrophales bacterium]|nr:hypothetical protein [Syntrophales bacterium]